MVFLNPSVLFGLLAASIPVIIHLINLRKVKRIEFSTLSFLKEIQKTKIRRVKLKQWLLLALRVLIILLIVFAFSRPTLRSTRLEGINSSAKTSALFLFDNSLSMSALGENGSLFNNAKAIAGEILNEFEEGDQLFLVPMASEQNEDIPGNNIETISKRINDLELSAVHNSISEPFEKGLNILRESKNINKELFIFSDFTEEGFNREEIASLFNDIKLDEDVKIYFMNFGEKEIANLGVYDFKLENQILESGKEINFSAVVSNYSDLPVNNSVASLYMNGIRISQKSVSLNPGESEEIKFNSVLKTTGHISAMVELESDDLEFDNKRYLSLSVPEKIAILELSEKKEDLIFVNLALNQAGDGNIRVTKRDFSELSSLNMGDYDLIISVGAPEVGSSDRIKKYLNDGGNIILFPGSSISETNETKYSNYIKTLGVGEINGKAPSGNGILFKQINKEHPLFTQLFKDMRDLKIDSPEIINYFKLKESSEQRVLIELEDNTPLLSEIKTGNKGKSLIFAIAPTLEWSNFPLKGIFAPIVVRSLFYMVSEGAIGSSLIVKENFPLNVGKLSLPKIEAVRPDDSREIINVSKRKGNYLNYSSTEIPGIYKFYSDGELIEHFAVNIDPKESRTEKIAPDEAEEIFAEAGFDGKIIKLDANENFSEKIVQARFGTELWKIFIMLAFVIAIIEMIVARSSKKDLINIDN